MIAKKWGIQLFSRGGGYIEALGFEGILRHWDLIRSLLSKKESSCLTADFFLPKTIASVQGSSITKTIIVASPAVVFKCITEAPFFFF